MTNRIISISPSSTSLTFVVISQLQLIRYVRACSTYDQFLVQGSLLTNKFMSLGFQLFRLQVSLRKFHGRYNNLICPYNLSLGNMLSDIFHINRYAVLDTLILTTVHSVYLIWIYDSQWM